jgi:Proteasome subunit
VSTGTYIANRVSDKIAQLTEHIYCCRSGSAADTQWLTDVVKHLLQQLWYVRICCCCCDIVCYIRMLYTYTHLIFIA